MKFHEKLRRRVDDLGLNKARAARDVGLPESTISNYLATDESLPRIDIAAKIAKAIHVPLQWLADDAADWPPPEVIDPLERMDDDILMFEVCKRHRRELKPFFQAIECAEKEDWKGILDAFVGWKPGDPLPEKAKDVPHAAVFRWGLPRIQEHNPWVASGKFHDRLWGADKPAAQFQEDEVRRRYKALLARPAFLEVMKLFEQEERWTSERMREQLIKDGWEQHGRGFRRPDPAPPTPPGAGDPTPSKPVRKPSKPRSKHQ